MLPVTHPWATCGVETLKASLSDPALEINLQVFPGAQLGSNEEEVAAVAQGSLDMTLPGVGSVSPFYAPFGVLEAVFAFKDLDHLNRVWNGKIGEELRQGASAAGIHVIGDLWYIGLRQITAKVAVRKPSDLAGLSMRSQDTPASFANIRALGAKPTPIAYGELYLALSQGVVDAEENPIANILSAKFYEVQNFLSVTNHVPQMGALLINQKRWDSLTAAQKAALEFWRKGGRSQSARLYRATGDRNARQVAQGHESAHEGSRRCRSRGVPKKRPRFFHGPQRPGVARLVRQGTGDALAACAGPAGVRISRDRPQGNCVPLPAPTAFVEAEDR